MFLYRDVIISAATTYFPSRDGTKPRQKLKGGPKYHICFSSVIFRPRCFLPMISFFLNDTGRYKMMQFLFQNGDTALHIAAAMGRRKLTKILLESGCDKDAKNKQNETAMDISRRKELAEIVSILQNPPPILSEKDREEQAMAARDRSQSHPRPSKSDKKREKTSTSSKENDHERGSKREKKRVSVSGQNDGPG